MSEKIYCDLCEHPIEDGERCYQYRYGYMEGDNDFIPKEDVFYKHERCF